MTGVLKEEGQRESAAKPPIPAAVHLPRQGVIPNATKWSEESVEKFK